MSAQIILKCDCLQCLAGPPENRRTVTLDTSQAWSARARVREEWRDDVAGRWTGDGDKDYAPGHEAAENEVEADKLALIEQRAQDDYRYDRFSHSKPEVPWEIAHNETRNHYRSHALRQLLREGKIK